MKKKIKKEIEVTVYACDICEVETSGHMLVFCSDCKKNVCKEHFKQLDVSFDSEFGYDVFCTECFPKYEALFKEADVIEKQIEELNNKIIKIREGK